MCLLVFAHRPGSAMPLVLAANRDEFFNRPTVEADFWNPRDDHRQAGILAGRDLQCGGAWLGITTCGRIAAVTNIRQPFATTRHPRSRGELTRDFLTGNESPARYCESLASSFDDFAPFNLLVGDRQALCYLNSVERSVQRLDAGIYGLSNGLLDSDWPKVRRGRRRLQALLGQDAKEPGKSCRQVSIDELLALMTDRQPAADAELPDTGVPLELERKLSSAFIENTERRYGTRCTTAIVVENAVTRFSEQNYDEAGAVRARHYFEFRNGTEPGP